MADRLPPDSRTALIQATQCLTDGRFDDRSLEGARVNAMESIAWSLVGLLQARTEDARAELGQAAQETLTDALRQAGLVELSRRER